ncbi:MAG: hypothetical protein Q7S89_01695, partial [bacterium]|nr:hypothetical protein [bacterium]
SAGNLGDPGVGTCNMHYPALRPETLVAGGLDTSYVTEENPFTPPSAVYDTLPIYAPTSRGGGTITVDGFAHSAVNIVNLVLPAEYGAVTRIDYVAGTSFSAGVLAGAVAVVRNAYGPLGWQTNARIVMTDQMLFGDGWNSDTGNNMSAGGSPRTGYGRVKFHYPSSNNLTAPWGWGGSVFNISQGQTVCQTVGSSGAESVQVQQLTATMMWFEPNFANAADIVFTINDNCPSACAQGGNPLPIATDDSFDNSKRIRLTSDWIGGKCLEMVTTAYIVPGGGTRTVYRADMWHSGNVADF